MVHEYDDNNLDEIVCRLFNKTKIRQCNKIKCQYHSILNVSSKMYEWFTYVYSI